MLLVPCRASDVAAVAPVQATAKRSALCHCQELRSRMARFPRKPKAQKHKSQITRQALGFRVLSPARSWSWTDTETETEPQTRSFPASGQAPSPSLCAHPFSVSALPLKNSLKQRNALHLASSPASSLLGSRLTHKQFVFAFRWRGREPRSPVPSPQTGDHDSRSHHPKKKKKTGSRHHYHCDHWAPCVSLSLRNGRQLVSRFRFQEINLVLAHEIRNTKCSYKKYRNH